MGFFTAVKVCLTTKYADFQSRAGRSEFWWFLLFCVLVEGAFRLALFLGRDSWGCAFALRLAHAPVFLLLLLPAWGAQIRRLHDTGRSGAWFWGMLISSAVGGAAFWLVWMFWTGIPLRAGFLLNLELPRLLLIVVQNAAKQAQIFFQTPLDALWGLYGVDPHRFNFHPELARLAVSLPAVIGLGVCLMRKGTNAANRYGPAPGAPDSAGAPAPRAGMDFPTALKSCVLRNYVGFRGRACRAEYWYFALGQLIFVSLCFSLYTPPRVFRLLASKNPDLFSSPFMVFLRFAADQPFLLAGIALLPLLLPGLAVLVRRLHDAGHSGGWVAGYALVQFFSGFAAEHSLMRGDPGILLFLLLVNCVYTLVLLRMTLQRGAQGASLYGPDPLAAAGETAQPASGIPGTA